MMVEYQIVKPLIKPLFEIKLPDFNVERFYNLPKLDYTDIYNPNYGTKIQDDNIHDDLLGESESVLQTISVDTSKRLTDAIQKHLGESYSQARRGLSGFSDCSSFVGKVLKDAGINVFNGLPTAKAMYESGKLKSVTKAQPGDLIFFRGTDNRGPNYISHIGIVAEVDPNGNPTKMAHASARLYKKTVIVNYNPNYWNKYKPEIKRLKV